MPCCSYTFTVSIWPVIVQARCTLAKAAEKVVAAVMSHCLSLEIFPMAVLVDIIEVELAGLISADD